MITDDIENLKADLALRVLFGAARHMSRTPYRWSDFLETPKSLEIDINLAVKILCRWYGDRPVVILADEVGKVKGRSFGAPGALQSHGPLGRPSLCRDVCSQQLCSNCGDVQRQQSKGLHLHFGSAGY
ncbi:Uncharacterized protein (Fragment) [Durusdinium trenchii]|uniref:Uncharacterized protein n=1 Tax=Durusdinium trenchii TaxID=1381693 RepID=A0ABP0LNI6_9DINO